MFEDMYPDAQKILYDDIARNGLPRTPVKPPGMFADAGNFIGKSAMVGGAYAARGAGVAGSIFPAALDKGRTGIVLDQVFGQDREPLQDKYFRWLDETTLPAVEYWKPDPSTAGTASQVIGGFARMVLPLMAGGGNPALVVAGEQVSAYDELISQGVDPGTANKAATVRGVSTAVGLALPAAMVPGRVAAAAAGAVVNPVVGISDRAATKMILENANYDKIAAQYKPLDATSLAIDALVGGAAGGALGKSRMAGDRPRPVVTPDQHAAALAAQSAQVADDATLVTIPDPIARTQAIDAQTQAARQVEAGERVNVAGQVQADPVRVEALRARAEARLHEMGFREEAPPAAPAEDIGATLQKRIETDFEGAKAEYAQLEDAKGGQVLNTDVARELSPAYRADRTRSADVHEPASAFVKRMYAEKLAAPTPEGKTREVLFTAGGTGAGKSTALDLLGPEGKRAEIIYDTNMNRFDSADEKIQQALDSGRAVKIMYVYRDAVEALTGGALPRAKRMGRTVPINEHARTHVGANETIARLAEKYKDDGRVEIIPVDNSRGKDNARIVNLDEVTGRDYNGLEEKLNHALEQEFKSERISEAIYRGTKAVSAREGTGGRVSGKPESGQVTEQPAGTQDAGTAAEVGTKPAGQGEATAARPDPVAALVAKNPDLVIRMEDGTDISAAEALRLADEDIAQAKTDSEGYSAAVACFLSRGGE
jgi:hypothetical protein